jgi:hypothetical protein
MKKYISLFFIVVFLNYAALFVSAVAQTKTDVEQAGVPQTGQIGISRTTDEIMRQEKSKADLGQPHPKRIRIEHEVERDDLQQNPESPDVSRFPLINTFNKNQSSQTSTLFNQQTIGITFLGAALNNIGAAFVPPDVMGDVGPTQYIVAINGRIRSFNKTTGTTDDVLDVDPDVFFDSVMTPLTSTITINYTSDPHIRYDRKAGRWYIIIIDVPTNNNSDSFVNRILLAVSNASIVTNSTTWTYFYIQSPSTLFTDYPTLGVDNNALYVGGNMFLLSDNSFSNTYAWVIKKSSILSSGPIVVTRFADLIDGFGNGPYTPQGVDNFDTTATEGYFVGTDASAYGKLQIRRVSNPAGTPSLSSNLSLTVPTTVAPLLVNHLGNSAGSAGRLSPVDDRLFAAVIRKGRLWTAHNIGVNNSGIATSPTRDGSRWYEIGTLNTTPTLIQSGTIYDNSTSVRNYWIPSVNISGQGHVALGFSSAGASDYINAGVVGRFSGDALGSMQSPVLYTSSSTAYNPSIDPGDVTYGRRWGDYSYTSVDPNDDMTMWTIQEICSSTNNWGVQVVKLIAPPPAISAGASPSSVNTNTSNVNVAITGTSSSGSGFFDPGSAFPNRLTAAINGGGVTVNSVTFTDATHLILNISVASGATASARTITVTNPDGQSTTSLTGILTINNVNCPTIILSPTTLPSGAAGSAYSQTVTASGGTSPYTYTVTSGSLPAGTTLLSAGLLSGTPLFGGSYNFTITATDNNACTGFQAFTLTITGCPQITVSPTSIPNGTVGSAFNQTITASGGSPSYSYAVTSGTLPTGLTLSSGGVLSGTPSVAGSYNFTITATDGNSCTGNLAYSQTIDPLVLTDISFTSLGTPYTQNFNTLSNTGSSNTWTNNSTIPGWFATPITYIASTGSSTTGGLYSFGASSGSERAFGSVSSNGTGTIDYGARFVNRTGSTITSLTVNYTGEQWRNGGNTTIQSLAFQYQVANAGVITSITSGTWTSFSALDFSSPIHTSTAAALDGNSTANRAAISSTLTVIVADGQEVWIRWVDVNDAGSDHGLAVDDFSVTPVGSASSTNPTIAGTANPSTVVAGNSTLLTATVTSGTNPTSTGIGVTGNLSSVGGSTTQTFYDDGTHGDVTASDNIFSYQATVSLGTTPGSKSMRVCVTDAQARTDSANISLTINAPPTNPSIAGTANPLTVVAGNSTLLMATVTPGTNPTSTGIGVTGNLSSIGGSITQLFYDDGTHGDVTASDNIFSYQATVSVGTTPGSKSMRVYVTDAQARIDSTSITININSPSCSTITLVPTSLPNAFISASYTQNVTASGGKSPYTFSITAGALAEGLILSSNGFLSGTPTSLGSSSSMVTATDSNGCSGSKEYILQVLCPQIVITPDQLPDDSIGKTYNQILHATGGTAPYSFTITNGTLPESLSLSSSGIISGTMKVAGHYDFTITVADANGCTAIRSYTVNISEITVSAQIPFDANWNLLSMPVKTSKDTVSVLFPTATSEAFGYTSGTYLTSDRMMNGYGYWLKFNSMDTVLIIGLPITDDTIDVVQGWNLIGSISRSISVNAVFGLGTTIQSSFFGYNGSYFDLDTIKPGKAFWIKVSTAGKLRLALPLGFLSTSVTKLERIRNTDMPNRLEFIDSRGSHQTLFFSMDDNQSSVNTGYELPPQPPPGSFDARFTSQRMAEIFSTQSQKLQKRSILISSSAYPVTVKWDVQQSLTQRYKLQIQERKKMSVNIPLEGIGSARVENPEVTKLNLIVQNKRDVPQRFALQQNYPNPFNPITTIEYQLPVESKVTVKIFNILGQVVHILKDEIQDAGYESVEWNAGEFASGMYFYKLEASSTTDPNVRFEQIRKLLLLK